MKKFQRNELVKEILKISSGLIVIGALIVAPGLAEIYRYFKAYKRAERNRIRNVIRKLEGKKYIRLENSGDNQLLTITPAGKKEILKYEYDEIEIKKPKKWDGKWRVVIFDIPEKKKKVRDQINFKLREIGFISLQKSTFVLPYECRNEIEFIRSHFSLRKEIRYIYAMEIDNQVELIKKFDLNI